MKMDIRRIAKILNNNSISNGCHVRYFELNNKLMRDASYSYSDYRSGVGTCKHVDVVDYTDRIEKYPCLKLWK